MLTSHNIIIIIVVIIIIIIIIVVVVLPRIVKQLCHLRAYGIGNWALGWERLCFTI
jgi:hypothetical protein